MSETRGLETPLSPEFLEALRRENDQLRIVLATRIVIEQAKGHARGAIRRGSRHGFRAPSSRGAEPTHAVARARSRGHSSRAVDRAHLPAAFACEQTVGSSTEGGLTVAETAEKPVVRRSRRHVGGTEGER